MRGRDFKSLIVTLIVVIYQDLTKKTKHIHQDPTENPNRSDKKKTSLSGLNSPATPRWTREEGESVRSPPHSIAMLDMCRERSKRVLRPLINT